MQRQMLGFVLSFMIAGALQLKAQGIRTIKKAQKSISSL